MICYSVSRGRNERKGEIPVTCLLAVFRAARCQAQPGAYRGISLNSEQSENEKKYLTTKLFYTIIKIRTFVHVEDEYGER